MLTCLGVCVILRIMVTQYFETWSVAQLKGCVAEEGSMKAQETRKKRIVPTTRGQRLNLRRVRQLATEHREALTILAKNDGQVLRDKNTRGR